MNFKTTAILLVLLVAVGGYVLLSRDKGTATDTSVTPSVHTVLDQKAADVTAVTVAGADGKTAVGLEKSGTAWRLTQPVKAAADTYKVTSLIDELTTNLKSTNVVAASGADAPKTGVDHPQYTVTVTTAAGHTATLAIGDRLGVGDGVYAQVAGKSNVDVVPATLLDALAKPASDLRKTQLFEGVASTDVRQLTLTHKDGSKVTLQKAGDKWAMVAPAAMPADTYAVDDLLSAVINLTPTSFVEDPADAVGLKRPNAVIAFSTAAPTTQPTTGPATAPAMSVVTLGGYDDVQKKNVFAALPDGSVVKVAATVLETFNKTPLDLRDKAVVDLDPAKVTKVEIAAETPATTQPATKPAVTKSVVLTRRPPKPVTVGPAKPTTGPASAPTTAPATPATEWVLDATGDADDTKVSALLAQFHPLRADKFLAANAIAQPTRKFTITLTQGTAAPVVIHVDEPGHDLSLVGTADGLTFNLPATLATDLAGDFKKGATPTTPTVPPAAFPQQP